MSTQENYECKKTDNYIGDLVVTNNVQPKLDSVKKLLLYMTIHNIVNVYKYDIVIKN